MPDRVTRLSWLYFFAGTCALFAIAHGALGLEPAPLMGFILG